MGATFESETPPLEAYAEERSDPLFDELTNAKRSGDLEAVGRIARVITTKFESQVRAGGAGPSRMQNQPARDSLPSRLVDEGRAAHATLDRMCPDAAADERLLNMLAAGDVAVALALAQVERQVAARMLAGVDGTASWTAVVRVLGDVVRLNANVRSRIQGTLTTAASLRAQRRFLERR